MEKAMNLETTTGDLLGALNKRNLVRYGIFVMAIIISVMAYRYIVTPYPDRDLFGQVRRWLFSNAYDFYSGQDRGLYFAIGSTLDNATQRMPGIKITNRTSAGGVENAIKVASSTSAFGLVQEDSIPEGDFIRNEIKFVTPLFLEQVHILYRKSKYEQYVKGSSSATVKVSPGSDSIIEFFSKAVISSGSPHSGSSIVASQILNTLRVAPKQDLQMPSGAAVSLLISQENISNTDGLDAVFWITGGPNGLIAEALKGKGSGGQRDTGEIGIMGIDPTIAQLINERYKSKLRPATFRGLYENGEGIPTIGVYSFLICSNDVPSFAVMDLLRVLESKKQEIRSAMGHPGGVFQLEQFNFKDYYKRNYHGFLLNLIKNLFIFLISVAVTSTGVMVFLVWIISGFHQVSYFRKLLYLYKEFTPNNAELEEKDPPFFRPDVYDNQMPVVSKLTRGTRELLLWGRAVRADYGKGLITSAHYSNLSKDFDKLRGIFQKSLSRRLCEALHSREVRDLVEERFIRYYYTAGFIQCEDYKYLLKVFSELNASKK
jgi:TRAP-type uncharacterized transport system substrate-binding protein